ncbi:hypothetical protein LWI28_022634 [Acer negundo]|uniref:Uncharacterized protein n=1 Tax=Acer negundo TaxID=4023 RepID=A0AAD5J7T8_ACENE|nr:hypothetical protein LWI28_022634 [Acer negundo]
MGFAFQGPVEGECSGFKSSKWAGGLSKKRDENMMVAINGMGFDGGAVKGCVDIDGIVLSKDIKQVVTLNRSLDGVENQETGVDNGNDFKFKDKRLVDIIATEDYSVKKGRLDVEVSKIMEVGVAVGFNFHHMEKEVMEEVYRRELEDAEQ